jgi:DNA-binding transcriptional MocR family regulator
MVLDALPKPELDANSTEPLYRQLAAWLRQGIASGRLKSGERLPATRELAQYLGLNRATVSAAYALLDEDQLLSGHVGKGSFVRSQLPEPIQANPGPYPAAAISFTTSRPAADLFPVDAFRRSCLEVLDSPQVSQILQLGSPQGYTPLRHYLLEQARLTGMAAPTDDILITSGCQQALDLLERLRQGRLREVEFGRCLAETAGKLHLGHHLQMAEAQTRQEQLFTGPHDISSSNGSMRIYHWTT